MLKSFSVCTILLAGLLVATSANTQAQDRPASPRGESSTQLDGSWVVVDYGRPILRGRTHIFAQGDTYGETVLAGAPVWRAGANQSTRFRTEADLMFGDHHLPAGEYSLFIDLVSASEWTLILSNHKAQAVYQEGEGIWGSFGYSPAKDVLRMPMNVSKAPFTTDQFTISFVDMTQEGGAMAFLWDDVMARVEFSTAP